MRPKGSEKIPKSTRGFGETSLSERCSIEGLGAGVGDEDGEALDISSHKESNTGDPTIYTLNFDDFMVAKVEGYFHEAAHRRSAGRAATITKDA
jgi:hypothetical protein